MSGQLCDTCGHSPWAHQPATRCRYCTCPHYEHQPPRAGLVAVLIIVGLVLIIVAGGAPTVWLSAIAGIPALAALGAAALLDARNAP